MFTPMSASRMNATQWLYFCDKLGKLRAYVVADKGHKRLKAAEVRARDESVFRLHFADGQTFADRDCKSVHRKSDSEDKDLNKTHDLTVPLIFFAQI